MSSDVWNGSGDWNSNASDWSLGAPPTASENALIETGTDSLTAAGVAAGLTIATMRG